MACWAVLFLTLVFVGFGYAFAEPAPNLVKSQDSLSTIAYLPAIDYPKLEIDLVNIGNGTADIVGIFKSHLYPKHEKNFSVLEPVIDKKNIVVNKIPKSIPEFGGSGTVSLQVTKIVNDEGIYNGRIIINGSNFKPITTDISIQYVVSPWYIFGMTLIGVFGALVVGWQYQQKEKELQEKKEMLANFNLVAHVAEHIVDFNTFRNKIDEETWKTIRNLVISHTKKLEEEAASLKVTAKSENVLWFENFAKTFNGELMKSTDNNWKDKERIPLPDVEYLQELVKLFKEKDAKIEYRNGAFISTHTVEQWEIIKKSVFDELRNESVTNIIRRIEMKIAGEKLKEFKRSISHSINSRDYGRGKSVFFVIALAFSSITSVLVLDSFEGHLLYNSIFGIGLGFVVYRSKDFQKIFGKDISIFKS